MGVDDYVIKFFSLLMFIVWMKVLYCCSELVEVREEVVVLDDYFDIEISYFKMNMKIWEVYLDNWFIEGLMFKEFDLLFILVKKLW